MRSFFIAENIRIVLRASIALFLIALGYYMLVGSRDIREQAKVMVSQGSSLTLEHAALEQEIAVLKQKIDYFSSTSHAYEQVAREELLMGKSGEQVYLLEK